MIQIVELLRLSTEEQFGNGHVGILRQKEENKKTIKKHGLKRHHTIELIDVSGTAVTKTPEIKNLISLMKSRTIQGIVISDMDRLCRFDSFRDFSLFQEFIDNDILIYTPDSVIDMNQQSGYLLGGLQSIISSNELTQIKKRMIQAKEIRRKQGFHPNNDLSLPLGVSYDRKKDRYYYNDKSGEIRNLFNLFYYQSIHNYRELERRTGIHHRTIYNLLQNKLFIGVREYTHKRSKVKNIKPNGRQGDKAKVPRTKDEFITNQVIKEPLIPPLIFNNVQKTIGLKNQLYHAKRIEHSKRFKYAALLKCGHCQEKIYHASFGYMKQDYYICSSKKIKDSIPCALKYCRRCIVDFTIDSLFFYQFKKKDFIDRIGKKTVKKNSLINHTKSYDSFTEKIKNLNEKKEKLIDLYLDRLLTKKQLTKKISLIDNKIIETQSDLDSFKSSTLICDYTFISECLNLLAIYLNEIKQGTLKQIKDGLLCVVNYIKVQNEGVAGFEINLPALFNNMCRHTGMDSWRSPA